MAIKETTDIKLAPEETAAVNGEKNAIKPKSKPRMLEQDVAKGIAIILVMALHTLTLNKNIYTILGGSVPNFV